MKLASYSYSETAQLKDVFHFLVQAEEISENTVKVSFIN